MTREKKRHGRRGQGLEPSGPLVPERADREIAATDAQIDNLVHDPYGITDVERKIIEAEQ